MKWLFIIMLLSGCREFPTEPLLEVKVVERPDSTWMCKTPEACT